MSAWGWVIKLPSIGGSVSSSHRSTEGLSTRIFGRTFLRSIGGTFTRSVGGTFTRIVGGTFTRSIGGAFTRSVGGTFTRSTGGTFDSCLLKGESVPLPG